MLKDIIEILKNISLRHKGVCTFKYQGDDLNNQQGNYKGFQVYVDDISLHQLNITTNIFKTEFQIYILSTPENTPEAILNAQNEAYTIAVDILAYIDLKSEYKGILSVYDYSILTLSHYTANNSAGVKLSLVIETPNPVNLCELDDNFNDEPYEEKDNEITINEDEVGDITLNPIKLPINNPCCR